jgi:hypothetical protein
MKTQTALVIASVLWLAAFTARTEAATFYTAFTVTGFPVSNGNAAPTDPVSGTIFWTAPDIHSDIQSFVSIDLTLDGHQYSTSEIGYFRLGSPTTWNGVGGTINVPNGIFNQTDDFYITWDSATLQPLDFSYASSLRSGIWTVDTVHQPNCFQNFVVAPVPEPGSTSLLLVGLLGAGACHGGKRIKRRA